MYVLASAEPQLLDAWRTTLGDRSAVVEMRRLDGLPECLARLTPQLLLLDLRLARAAVSRSIAQLLKVSPTTRIVAFADERDEDYELDLFRAGVRGVCALGVSNETVAKAVSAVLRGEIWIRRALLPKLCESLVAERPEVSSVTGQFSVLTPREIEIARLIGQGASNKRIARHLAITEQTVKGHLTAIFRKTGVVDRVKLALLVARRH